VLRAWKHKDLREKKEIGGLEGTRVHRGQVRKQKDGPKKRWSRKRKTLGGLRKASSGVPDGREVSKKKKNLEC